jgi:general secretion pathway protein B
MSYILDALRKAEAERERGNVPNIHAQPAFAGARPSAAPVKSRMWVVVLALAVLLVLAAALVGYLLWGRSAPNDAALASAGAGARQNAPAAVPAAVPTTPPAAVPANVTPAPVAQAPVATPAPATVSPTLAPMPTTPAPVPTSAAATPARKPRAAPALPDVAAAASLPAPAASATATNERIYAMAELPDNIRQQLPALAVGGSMYSSSAASRLVIINGQVLHEGERLTPDLTVQQIKPKSAVLSMKGYRFTLPF